MELWIGLVPRQNNAIYFSNRLNILDRPLINLKKEYYHILVKSLLQDRLISYKEQTTLYEIFPFDEDERITLEYLESISPYPMNSIFRYLRKFFRHDGKMSLYNPIIPGFAHISLLPVLYSIFSFEETINIDTIIIDMTELFSYEEIYLANQVASFLKSKLIIVTENPTREIVSLCDKIILSPSFSIKILERILGENISELKKDFKIVFKNDSILEVLKKGYSTSSFIVKKPKKIDYLARAFKEESNKVYNLLSEIYESGSIITFGTLLSLLETSNISMSLYNKIIKYGFLQETKGGGGIQVSLTPKAYYILESYSIR